MALLFMDGFDAGDALTKWPAGVLGGVVSTTTRHGSGSSWNLSNFTYTLVKNITASSTLFAGAALRVPAAESISILGFMADTATTLHLNIRITGTNQLSLYTGNTLLASYTHASSFPGRWYYFELGGTVAATGGTATVRIDGVQVISFTGNTKNGGTSTNLDAVRLQGSNSGGLLVDDAYVANDAGGAPYNTFLGDVRVQTLVPNAAGSSTQMTPSSGANYTTVDELPYSATDYVQGTIGQLDTYSTSDLLANTGTVHAVQTCAVVKKTDAGTVSGKVAIKSGATTYFGAAIPVGTNDQTITDLRTVDPNTSATWTAGNVNAIEIGIGAQ